MIEATITKIGAKRVQMAVHQPSGALTQRWVTPDKLVVREEPAPISASNKAKPGRQKACARQGMLVT
jgi:hypothetical protein